LPSALGRTLFRHVLFPAGVALLRLGSTAARREMEAFQWLGPAASREAQWRRLRSLLRHAAATVPYYRKVFGELGLAPEDFTSPAFTPEDFAGLPLLTKETVRREFPAGLVSEDGRTRGRPRRRPQVFETSGTTGYPLRVYRDPALRSQDHAERLFLDGWAGLRPGDQTVHLRPSVFVSRRVYPLWSLFGGGHHLPLALVAERDAAGIAAFLERWRPDALSGVTAVLTQAAQTLRQSGRVHRVKAITIEGETLDAGICRILTEAFGAPIHDRYGAREFGVWMAQSCPQRVAAGEPPYRNLHVAAWRFLVEAVDDAGRPVEPGRESRLVITDLANRLMPFIRYDLGDIGALAPEPCPCGRGLPLLATLSGRQTEVLILPSGLGVPAAFLHMLLEDRTSLFLEYQFIQTSTDRLEIAVVPAPGAGFGPADAAELERRFRDYLKEPVEVAVRVVDAIPLTPAGKRPLLRTLP